MSGIVSGDVLAQAMGGVLYQILTPSAPSLSLTAGTGQVTVTISGDAGVTHYLKYKKSSGISWLDGGSRSGDGDITVTGLANDVPYIFIAYSEADDGTFSTPSVAVWVTLTTTAAQEEFDDILSDTADEFLDVFAISIKYLPAGGGQRTINGMVMYESPETFGNAPHGHAPALAIAVANNSTTGISSSEVNLGGDKVELALRIGESVQQRRITRIISQDSGMMQLEIR